MPKKPIGLKFEEADLERWDAWAMQRGYSRTSLIEAAVNAFIHHGIVQKPIEEKPPESQPPEENQPPRPRAGIRRAYICHKCSPPTRTFLPAEAPQDLVPECRHHGKMEHQPNQPYFAQSTK